LTDWRSEIDLSRPCWDDYRDLLQQLDGPQFPQADELCHLLPVGLASLAGQAIRFVAADHLPAEEYEHRIYTKGEVSTRQESWHDLFNALVWSRFPRLKAAMNALHLRDFDSRGSAQRSKLRDALTLLDESGAIVVSADQYLLKSLAQRDWSAIFRSDALRHPCGDGQNQMSLFLCGHALLEKFLQPYKAITAQVLLLHTSEEAISQPREILRRQVDRLVADELVAGRLFTSPRGLSPLPLMGLPGWWTGVQDFAFYADQNVFRPLSNSSHPAPVFTLQLADGRRHLRIC